MKKSLHDRFWEKVVIAGANECWLWQATKTNFGYGSFRVGSVKTNDRRKEMAHRIAYSLTNAGPLPVGMVVMHSCDNPPCVNPAHLSLGSYAENAKAAYDRKRRVSTVKPNDSHPRAKLTSEIVLRLRTSERHLPLKILALRYGVSESTIDAARRGVNWTL